MKSSLKRFPFLHNSLLYMTYKQTLKRDIPYNILMLHHTAFKTSVHFFFRKIFLLDVHYSYLQLFQLAARNSRKYSEQSDYGESTEAHGYAPQKLFDKNTSI